MLHYITIPQSAVARHREYCISPSRQCWVSSFILRVKNAEELKEDPVTFLTRVQEECPDVLSVLTKKQVILLSKPPTEPYNPDEVNEQFLTDMAASIGIEQRVDDAKQALRLSLLTPHNVKEEVDVKSFEKQLEILKKVSWEY